jgi:hypothetical protein
MMQILISDNLILTQTDPLLVKNIWLSAAHIPGKCNPADIESRVFNDNVEWMLDSNVFLQLAKSWGKPTMDLFASRLN